ncbi:Molybdopterin or thiamine biosynthesis adenylyltransferase [Enhydrobacter aerosaccus]|uniref:Molybdopterin or thiamine biosynthesis adenylyltransferase n=1 Tax=Enhydrobacter aerosaccus TaxID=225324 RepID=A0A1T4P8I8_9HYPH|nr:HesA/MoeB/ThiF family protein [Enhydrobacter aerosaccus]SJZ87637.1 Molybdopterin or thiamine biosynthesis adenylyltransferase [Enhydrobacter aerosaccus]
MTDRYARQTILGEVGVAGQAKLAAASVLVVGAGGLGCPVLQYLAGAGIGHLTIVDHDTVEETNLHRQPLYAMFDIGRPKAEAARAVLQRFNPGIVVEAVVERLTPQNVERLVAAADIVVDAADSFAATYILSDACHVANKPLVSASVIGLTGYVGAFCGGSPSYRAVFPEVSIDGGTCATVGVLGTAVAVLGSLQAHIVLNLLLGMEPSPLGRVVTFDAKRLVFGGFGFEGSPEAEATVPFIAPSGVRDDDLVVDLRGLDEAPVSPFSAARRLDVDHIDELVTQPLPSARIVLCCRSGQRALMAADRLRERGLANLALVALG